jgi:hypothetical protein
MADDDMNMEEESGLMDRIKESPRTVSALIIILIVAAAIYAFSGDDANEPAEVSENGLVVSEELSPGEETEVDEMTAETVVGETAGELTRVPESIMELPEPSKTDQAYIEVAQPGNGLTHLARSAAGRWLSQNQAGYEVTNEHKIYIEDYVKDHLKRQPVALGQEVAIPFNLIADAVAAAGELNEAQLTNLQKYSANVTW